MDVIKCKCVECTTSRVMDVSFQRDLQHLVLTLCRLLFDNIQEKSLYKNLQLNQKMYHGDISDSRDLQPFMKIFKNAKYLQFKSVTCSYSSSKITFNYQWDLNDQDLNLNHLIEISKIHYQSFLSFFHKIDRWRRLSLKSLTNSTILSKIEQVLPEFKYLYDFHWITNSSPSLSSSSPSEPGVFFLASEFGVCIVIVIKTFYHHDSILKSQQDLEFEHNEYITLVKNYKNYATERHGNKLLTVIGATFNEDQNCPYPFEFVDEVDFSIAKSIQAYSNSTSQLNIYQAPRQETYELDTVIYGQSWDQQPELTQRGPTQLKRMPLNPGKSTPIVGADWAYYHQTNNEHNDFEENNYFNRPNYNNHHYSYLDYFHQNYH